jgi:replicative DNA helicase
MLPLPTDRMQSPDSEKLILAAAMDARRGPLLDSLLSLVAASDFATEYHGVLWGCIRVLHETSNAHDVVALVDYTRKKNLFVGGVEYLTALMDNPLAVSAEDASILAAAERVKFFSSLRNMHEMLTQGLRMCEAIPESLDSVFSYVDDGVQHLRTVNQTSRTGPVSMSEVMNEVMLKLDSRLGGEEDKSITPTGFDEVDKLIGGLADEDLVVIGARPGMGKTTLAMNISEHIAGTARRKVLVFSLEMSSTSLGQRALARKSHVSLSSITRGEIHDSDWSRLTEGIESLGNAELWIDDTPGLTIGDIRARARAFMRKQGKALIVVDYLQFISNSAGGEKRDHVAECSRGLKELAREEKTAVVALSQLSRALESRTNKRPIMSDLRESGAIEQDADKIIFIYRDEVYHPETKEPGIAEGIVAKNRSGPLGFARLGFEGSTNSFYNLSSAY